MINYLGLGHICVVVDNIEKATQFYQQALFAIPVQEFPHFQNLGFAKAAGFLEKPEEVNLSICFLQIPHTNIFLELMEFHSPSGKKSVEFFQPNDMGGVRHICLKVSNIDEGFKHLKNLAGVTMINQNPEYKPYKIDAITPSEMRFFDQQLEENLQEKQKVCQTVGNTRYFYFLDPYGIQWELEQGHIDIGD